MSTRTLNLSPHPDHQIGFLIWGPPRQNQRVEIGEFLTIGRDSANQIFLDDPFLSVRHARVERKPGGFLLRDMRSRNGTFVNGTRIVEALLHDGDRLRVGGTELVFTHRRDLATAVETLALSSRNPGWQLQLDRLPGVALSPFPVLLTGPSGTGKDVLARSLHELSPRRSGPFVSVNCSALSESLVESELFGHVRGSFTGATGDRKGAFEAARGGTLFLDEVGDLPLSLQPKLLRALENNQIRPVGSDKDLDTNVRIIAATHHDLRQLVGVERFRADLYFRLHVIQIQTPSLRERMEDFDDLFYSFARDMRVRFSFAAIERLKNHAWPGNIRELRNVVARAKAYWGNDEIGPDRVAQLIDVMPDQGGGAPHLARTGRSMIKELEYEMIKRRLLANHGNQRKTASDLGIPKSTLHDRIRGYGIDVEQLVGAGESREIESTVSE